LRPGSCVPVLAMGVPVLACDERAAGALVPVLEDQLYRRVGIYALYPQSRFLPPKTRAFIELLEAMFAEEEALFRH